MKKILEGLFIVLTLTLSLRIVSTKNSVEHCFIFPHESKTQYRVIALFWCHFIIVANSICLIDALTEKSRRYDSLSPGKGFYQNI